MDGRTKDVERLLHVVPRGDRRVRLAGALVVGVTVFLALGATAQAYGPGAMVWLRTQGTYARQAFCTDVAGGPGGTVVQTGRIENKALTNNDILVMKTDAAGHRLFTQALNGRQNRDDIGESVATDRWGDVFVAGTIGVSATNTDLVVIKYSPTGKRLWVCSYDGPGHREEFNAKLLVDAQGAAYVAATSYLNAAQLGIVVMKFDAGGHRTWLTRFDPVKNTQAQRWFSDMTMDDAGNLYLCGGFLSPPPTRITHLIAYKVDANGNARWGAMFSAKGGAGAGGNVIAVRGDRVVVGGAVERSQMSSYMLMVGYDTTGVQKFAFSYGSKFNGLGWVSDVVLDRSLNAYLTGKAPVAPGSPPVEGFMTLRVDPRGRLIWGRSSNQGDGYNVSQDSTGAIFVTGYATTASQGRDWETVSFTPQGAWRWLRTWNDAGNGDDEPSGLVVSGAHMLFVGGDGYANDTVKGPFWETALIRYER